MSKTICKIKDKETKAEKSGNARFSCRKCGAEARKEKNLCKPDKLK